MLQKEKATELLSELGERIGELRIKKGLSQASPSLLCGISKGKLSKIEAGKIDIPFSIICQLSQYLNASITEITG